MAEKRPAYCLYRERKSLAESFRARQRGGMRCPPQARQGRVNTPRQLPESEQKGRLCRRSKVEQR